MFFEFTSHEDALDKVAHIPPPTQDGSVYTWGADYLKQCEKALEFKGRKRHMRHEVTFDESTQVWDVQMFWQGSMNSVMSLHRPRTSPERSEGRLEWSSPGVPKLDANGKPVQVNPLPWSLHPRGDEAPHLHMERVLTMLARETFATDQYQSQYEDDRPDADGFLNRMHPMDLARRTHLEQTWDMLLDGVEAFLIRHNPGALDFPEKNTRMYWVRGGYRTGARIVWGKELKEFSITHEGMAEAMDNARCTASLRVLDGQFYLGDSLIDGLNVVIEFEPELGGSQKPQVWSLWAEKERHEDGDFFEDVQWFHVHHFLVSKVPNVDKKTGKLSPNKYQVEIDEYLANLRLCKKAIKEKLGASWDLEKLSMPRFE